MVRCKVKKQTHTGFQRWEWLLREGSQAGVASDVQTGHVPKVNEVAGTGVKGTEQENLEVRW